MCIIHVANTSLDLGASGKGVYPKWPFSYGHGWTLTSGFDCTYVQRTPKVLYVHLCMILWNKSIQKPSLLPNVCIFSKSVHSLIISLPGLHEKNGHLSRWVHIQDHPISTTSMRKIMISPYTPQFCRNMPLIAALSVENKMTLVLGLVWFIRTKI